MDPVEQAREREDGTLPRLCEFCPHGQEQPAVARFGGSAICQKCLDRPRPDWADEWDALAVELANVVPAPLEDEDGR